MGVSRTKSRCLSAKIGVLLSGSLHVVVDVDRWLDVWRSQELSAASQMCGDVAACQESVMANADEPFGQHMQQDESDKLVGAQPHDLGTMIVGIILPVERDLAVL